MGSRPADQNRPSNLNPEPKFKDFLYIFLILSVYIQIGCSNPEAAVLEWYEIFCIGHDPIDRDRQKIFALSNRLYAAFRPMNPPLFMATAKETLVFLHQQFMHEERILDSVNVAERTQHRQVHQEILAKLNALHGKLLDGRGEPKEFLFFLIYEVIIYHMLDYDCALKPVSADLRRTRSLSVPSYQGQLVS